jgi:hypothetical protein
MAAAGRPLEAKGKAWVEKAAGAILDLCRERERELRVGSLLWV